MTKNIIYSLLVLLFLQAVLVHPWILDARAVLVAPKTVVSFFIVSTKVVKYHWSDVAFWSWLSCFTLNIYVFMFVYCILISLTHFLPTECLKQKEQKERKRRK